MKTTITFNELLALLLRKGKLAIIIAVIFALLLGGAQSFKQISAARSENNSPEKIEERYQDALKTYERTKEDLQVELEQNERRRSSQQEYNENSLRMRLDPFNQAMTKINFSITDVDGAVFQQVFQLEGTPVEYIISKIQGQYLSYWSSLDLEQTLEGCSYAGSKDKYLRELVSLDRLEGGGLTLTAYGETENDAQELADAAYNCLLSIQPTIEAASYSHQFFVINKTTKILVDESLADSQRANLKQIEMYQTNLEETQKRLDELKEPTRETGYSMKTIPKAVLKWAVMGAVAGLFLAAAWIFFRYAFWGYAESAHRLELGLSLVFLGSAAEKEDFWERLANCVSGEKRWRDAAEKATYLSENCKLSLVRNTKVTVLSTLASDAENPAVRQVLETLASCGCSGHYVNCAGKNPEVISVLQDCDNVVFAEKIGVSRWEDMKEAEALVKRVKKPIVGFVII